MKKSEINLVQFDTSWAFQFQFYREQGIKKLNRGPTHPWASPSRLIQLGRVTCPIKYFVESSSFSSAHTSLSRIRWEGEVERDGTSLFIEEHLQFPNMGRTNPCRYGDGMGEESSEFFVFKHALYSLVAN